MHNFDTEAYTNNEISEKWPDRPFENALNYKKLDYTGNLKRSIKPLSTKKGKTAIATLRTRVRYAKIHNEGTEQKIPLGSPLRTGSPYRNPPYAAEKIFIGYARKKRQYMGIGTKTITQAKKRINEILRKYL